LVGIAADEEPEHLKLARELVEQVKPDHNRYDAKPTRIVWPDEAAANSPVSNNSVCSSFSAALLRKAYRLDKSDLVKLFSEEWPEADDMYEGVQKSREFDTIDSVKNLKPGDFLLVNYLSNKAIPTGHVMLVSGEPEKVERWSTADLPLNFASEASTTEFRVDQVFEWHVRVIDSSKSPHGKEDTRYRSVDGVDDDGVGEGPIRLLCDDEGKILGYTWSTFSNSRLWLVEDRPILIARWKR